MIKAVLFDMDGVLCDSCEWHYEAFNKALKEVYGFEITREDHLSTYNGLSTRNKLHTMVTLGRIDQDENRISLVELIKQAFTIEIITTKATPEIDKNIMLRNLHYHGYKTGCVTNCIRKTTELILEKTNIKDLFDIIVTNEDVKLNKPHPDCYLHAMKQLEVKPDETLIIEDSPKGIDAAIASGARVWQVINSEVVNWMCLEEILKQSERLNA